MYYVMDSRIVPQIHLADYWILKPPCAHKKRVPHEYIAYLIQKGELYLAEDGITYHLHTGDFILLDPDKYHEWLPLLRCFSAVVPSYTAPDPHILQLPAGMSA